MSCFAWKTITDKLTQIKLEKNAHFFRMGICEFVNIKKVLYIEIKASDKFLATREIGDK